MDDETIREILTRFDDSIADNAKSNFRKEHPRNWVFAIGNKAGLLCLAKTFLALQSNQSERVCPNRSLSWSISRTFKLFKIKTISKLDLFNERRIGQPLMTSGYGENKTLAQSIGSFCWDAGSSLSFLFSC